MKLGDIYAYLDTLSPFATQASWDNSGLLIGQKSDEIESVYLSLDIDSSLLEHIPQNALIITHHPLLS